MTSTAVGASADEPENLRQKIRKLTSNHSGAKNLSDKQIDELAIRCCEVCRQARQPPELVVVELLLG